jgi:hypothetical protein
VHLAGLQEGATRPLTQDEISTLAKS